MADPFPSTAPRTRRRRPVSPAQQALLETMQSDTSSCSLCLVSADAGKNRNRLYRLTWQQTLWGEGALTCWWGRRGSDGQTQTSFYPDAADAVAEFRHVLRTRLRHGYRALT